MATKPPGWKSLGRKEISEKISDLVQVRFPVPHYSILK
jgi:hypothetical protein